MVTSENDGDMKAHRATYEGVMGLLKWSLFAIAIIAATVIFVIAR